MPRTQYPRRPPKYTAPKSFEPNTAYDRGYRGAWPEEQSEWYLRQWTAGREKSRSEHRDTTTSMVFESANMENFSRRGRVGG